MVSGKAAHWEPAAPVLCCASYLAAPVTAVQDREKLPSAKVAVSPSGAGGASSATSVTVTVTVAVPSPPCPSEARTVRL